LSRNISINKLQNKIKIFQIPLGNKKNKFLKMKESAFVEGSALHVFGENYNYKGEKFLSNNNYKIYGTTINYLLSQKILDIPDYIKIDVDGIEHEILKGANLYLKNLKIKSLLIELNKNFKKQFNTSTAKRTFFERDSLMKHSRFVIGRFYTLPVHLCTHDEIGVMIS
jgi:FkbM family methyltransferase